MTFIPLQRQASPTIAGNWWGQYNTPNGLPNVAGSDVSLNLELQAGDMAYVESLGVNVICLDPTPGSAQWQRLEGDVIFPLQPEFVIDQVSSAGAGNSAFNFAMGCEIRVLNLGSGGTITRLAAKMGAGSLGQNPHSWVLRRSTVVSPNPPALGTYTLVLDSGTHSFAAANVWEQVTPTALPIPILENEWYTFMMWVGGGGQSEAIASMRSQGELSENLATLQNGLFVPAAGPPPGSTPVPTGRSTTMFGMTSIEVTPP